MKIVFMGTPEYATTILRALVAKFEIVGIFCQPDRPVGRKQILTPPSVKIWAQENLKSVPIFQPNRLREGDNERIIRELAPEFIVVAAYGQILPEGILEIAPCINLHASILPKFRGASPIQSAILAGEAQTGVTAMLMDEGLDTGDMLGFARTSCEGKMASELFSELGELAGELIVKVLQNFTQISPIKQNSALASHCKKILKSDGLVDFSESASEIYNKFRALTPWPGIYTASGLKILNLELAQDFKDKEFDKFGQILSIQKDGFCLSCKRGAIKITALQEPSKKPISASDFINGKRLGVGEFLCR
ncbi:methionyl-tRNA formyltransferase [Campylobacter sp. JMF_04 NA10]|uniref:methionyl-tRNA formyltransferase n=1 Tax=Campylobacter sp. JMF_04 NA10 TaxID=2983824 RepID=UPI0022E9A321|nr:methionyl-tRNA formyltransferase [Campylobacter sp. JMF_04 NA10]MDA3076087.1 methionyl-tRNA formyltransferase [Campylobacter sp. JMF_04 NA10]